MKVSVIIPFLNEAENIGPLTSALSAYFKSRTHYRAEVVFVNDGSTDDSVALLRSSVHDGYEAKLVSLSRNFGSHAALRAGIRVATGDRITFVYADLQDPLTLIDQLLDACVEGGIIAWASRESTQSKGFEKWFSRTYASLMKKYAVRTYPENGFDVVMFDRKVQEVLNANVESHSSVFLQILTMGFRQSHIRYHKEERKLGKSKWTLGKKIKLFVDSFVAFSYAPIRFVTMVGVGMFVAGILVALYLILRKLIADDLNAGWPALVSILMVGFGLTNISLGIIAEYLWRTLDAARKRPVYIVDEIAELNHDR